MDSITHALYRAVAASPVGLRALALTPSTHQCFADAAGTDLHVALEPSTELLAMQLEFLALGYCPPAGLSKEGADIIISPGRVDVIASTDDGSATWNAVLTSRIEQTGRGLRRAGWEEQVA